MKLTAENYSKGFLIDEELLGGVSEAPDRPGKYLGYVMRHTTGESLSSAVFDSLEAALGALNQVKRPWDYEKSSGCGDCADGKCSNNANGTCVIGGCGKSTSR